MINLTPKQIDLIKFYAEKAGLKDYEEVIEWVESGVVTITELSGGILGRVTG